MIIDFLINDNKFVRNNGKKKETETKVNFNCDINKI